jgi:ankyrin repeat protein
MFTKIDNKNLNEQEKCEEIKTSITTKQKEMDEILDTYRHNIEKEFGDDIKTVNQKVAHKKKILAQERNILKEKNPQTGGLLLHHAVENNLSQLTKLLLSFGSPIDELDNKGRTALHIAVEKDYEDITLMLIYHQCNVNLLDSRKETALHKAKKLSMVNNILIATKFKINKNIRNVEGKLAEDLLKSRTVDVVEHSDIEEAFKISSNAQARSFLHLAVINNSLELVKYHLNLGAPINDQDGIGKTALHLAAEYGYCDILSLLCQDERTDINITDNDGNTALHKSIEAQKENSVRILMKEGLGIDKRIKNHKGLTPYDVLCTFEKKTKLIPLLVALINAPEKKPLQEPNSPNNISEYLKQNKLSILIRPIISKPCKKNESSLKKTDYLRQAIDTRFITLEKKTNKRQNTPSRLQQKKKQLPSEKTLQSSLSNEDFHKENNPEELANASPVLSRKTSYKKTGNPKKTGSISLNYPSEQQIIENQPTERKGAKPFLSMSPRYLTQMKSISAESYLARHPSEINTEKPINIEKSIEDAYLRDDIDFVCNLINELNKEIKMLMQNIAAFLKKHQNNKAKQFINEVFNRLESDFKTLTCEKESFRHKCSTIQIILKNLLTINELKNGCSIQDINFLTSKTLSKLSNEKEIYHQVSEQLTHFYLKFSALLMEEIAKISNDEEIKVYLQLLNVELSTRPGKGHFSLEKLSKLISGEDIYPYLQALSGELSKIPFQKEDKKYFRLRFLCEKLSKYEGDRYFKNYIELLASLLNRISQQISQVKETIVHMELLVGILSGQLLTNNHEVDIDFDLITTKCLGLMDFVNPVELIQFLIKLHPHFSVVQRLQSHYLVSFLIEHDINSTPEFSTQIDLYIDKCCTDALVAWQHSSKKRHLSFISKEAAQIYRENGGSQELCFIHKEEQLSFILKDYKKTNEQFKNNSLCSGFESIKPLLVPEPKENLENKINDILLMNEKKNLKEAIYYTAREISFLSAKFYKECPIEAFRLECWDPKKQHPKMAEYVKVYNVLSKYIINTILNNTISDKVQARAITFFIWVARACLNFPVPDLQGISAIGYALMNSEVKKLNAFSLLDNTTKTIWDKISSVLLCTYGNQKYMRGLMAASNQKCLISLPLLFRDKISFYEKPSFRHNGLHLIGKMYQALFSIKEALDNVDVESQSDLIETLKGLIPEQTKAEEENINLTKTKKKLTRTSSAPSSPRFFPIPKTSNSTPDVDIPTCDI